MTFLPKIRIHIPLPDSIITVQCVNAVKNNQVFDYSEKE
jgi:hypothetical protein